MLLKEPAQVFRCDVLISDSLPLFEPAYLCKNSLRDGENAVGCSQSISVRNSTLLLVNQCLKDLIVFHVDNEYRKHDITLNESKYRSSSGPSLRDDSREAAQLRVFHRGEPSKNVETIRYSLFVGE